MSELKQIIDIALAEVGYLEKSKKEYEKNPEIIYDKYAGAGEDNCTKYAKEMDDLNLYNGKKNFYPWCKVFVDWCFVQSAGESRARELLLGWTAGVQQEYNWYKANKMVYSTPEVGDLIIFGDCDHIGIVENFDNFRNNSTVEEYGANGAEALLSQKEKQHRDEYNAHTDTKQMLKTKQPVVGTENRGHKTPHL